MHRIKTVSEYLAYDNVSPGTYEFIEGKCIPRHGADLIAENFRNELNRVSRNEDLRILMNQLLRIGATNNYCYPELAVTLTEPSTPAIVLEVVFEETQQMDRVLKASLYRSMPSVRQVLLVSASNVSVHLFERSETGGWSFREYCELEESVELPTLGCSVSLSAIYRHAFMRPIEPPEIDPVPKEVRERQLSQSVLYTTFFNFAAVALTYVYLEFQENDLYGKWFVSFIVLAVSTLLMFGMWRARQRPFVSLLFGMCGFLFMIFLAIGMVAFREPDSKFLFLFNILKWGAYVQIMTLLMPTLQLYFLKTEDANDNSQIP
jgi:Putative restriction endonuclease